MNDRTNLQEVFKQYLLSSKDGIQYCKTRGITKQNVCDGIVGLCPPSYQYGYPLMQGRLTVAIQDVHGTIIAFAGRQADWLHEFVDDQFVKQMALEDAHKAIKFWDKAKWYNEVYDKRYHLFNLNRAKESIRKKNYAIVNEGYLDTLIFSNYEIENTVATCGTALTDHHIGLLSRFCDNIVVMYDPDVAGSLANDEAIKKIEKRGLKAFSVQLPSGYDPDTIVMKYGGEKIGKAIDNLVYNNEKKVLKVKE